MAFFKLILTNNSLNDSSTDSSNDSIKQQINIGYYKRDNEMNIINDMPYFDHHEEQTRFNDPNTLLLYASLTYKE